MLTLEYQICKKKLPKPSSFFTSPSATLVTVPLLQLHAYSTFSKMKEKYKNGPGLQTLNFHCHTFPFIFKYSFTSERMDILTLLYFLCILQTFIFKCSLFTYTFQFSYTCLSWVYVRLKHHPSLNAFYCIFALYISHLNELNHLEYNKFICS